MTMRYFSRARVVARVVVTVAFLAIAGTTLAGVTACSLDKMVGSAPLPDSIVDPSHAKTAAGAKSAYYSALIALRETVGNGGNAAYALTTGLLTDELDAPVSVFLIPNPVALRAIPPLDPNSDFAQPGILYRQLQKVRGMSNQARGLLRDYGAKGSEPLIGHLLAVTGYAELMLAEAYCSGIPLSTLDYNGDYTYRAGSPTDSVLTHAIALFDSAAALAGDSTRIKNLAIVGKARAQLQLGRFNDAAATAATVPVDYQYQLMYDASVGAPGLALDSTQFVPMPAAATNVEGKNGMPWLSQPDGRLPPFRQQTGSYTYTYPNVGPVGTITLASGVEAELIRAEAALHNNDAQWLTIVNTLRTSCTDAATCSTPAPAGTGGVAGLPPLSDPGLGPLPAGKTAMDVRVDLLFRERAYWMFLTGHRQGDLRRLVHLYGRNSETVYPTGARNDGLSYGSDVTLPVPGAEMKYNPLYRGCINRNA